jgi:hypothetical protein
MFNKKILFALLSMVSTNAVFASTSEGELDKIGSGIFNEYGKVLSEEYQARLNEYYAMLGELLSSMREVSLASTEGYRERLIYYTMLNELFSMCERTSSEVEYTTKLAKALIEGVKKKYGNVSKFFEMVEEAASGELYDQIGKFVGRMEIRSLKEPNDIRCENGMAGTGTVISYEEMPEKLKGRVVISAFHMHPNALESELLFDSFHCGKTEIATGDNSIIYLVNTIRSQYFLSNNIISLEEGLFFTPDFASDTTPKYSYRKRGVLEGTSIPVERCYCFKDNNNHGVFTDIAIFILKDSVKDESGQPIEGVRIKNLQISDGEVFAIGYGRPSTLIDPKNDTQKMLFEKAEELSGWGIKKTTMKTRGREGKQELLNDEIIGPSDSGAPIIQEKDGEYLFLGVAMSDSTFCPIFGNFFWITAILNNI